MEGRRLAVGVIARAGRVLALRAGDAATDAWTFPTCAVEGSGDSEDALRQEVLSHLALRLSTMWLLDTLELPDVAPPTCADCLVCTPVPGEDPREDAAGALRWLSRDELLGTAWDPVSDGAARLLGRFWDQVFETEHL